MKGSEWIMILAILLAPLVAVQVQKYIELILEKRSRKLKIFHTLMATRATRLVPVHVEALNMIDIEFYGKGRQEKEVQDAWKIYLDHLFTDLTKATPEEIRIWTDKGNDLFTELLYKMSQSLNYSFDKVHLKKSVYWPRAHSELEADQIIIRKGLVDLFDKNRPIPISIVSSPISEQSH